MKRSILIVLLLVAPGRASEDLPLELRVLRQQRNERVQAINEGYLGNLKRLQEDYQHRGDLETAVLAAKWLKEWKEGIALRSPEDAESRKLPETKKELSKFLLGSQWDLDDQKGMTFREDGTFSNETVRCTYVVTDFNAVTIQWGANTVIPCLFSKDFSEFVGQKGLRKTFRRVTGSR